MRKLTTDVFIERSKHIHGNHFTYENTFYVNNNTLITVTCQVHGDINVRPDHHLKGHMCKQCSVSHASKNKLITVEVFLNRAEEVHRGKYTYPNFIPCKAKDKIDILCKCHGLFQQSYDSHLNKMAGCPECSKLELGAYKKLNIEQFIERAKSIHGNIYDYSKVKYISYAKKVEIICPDHGSFLQTPNNHLYGKKCNICSKENNSFQKERFIKTKCKTAIFYVLKCFNDNEEFYKIGITTKSVKYRYNTSSLMPYQYEILKTIEDTPENIWNMEYKYKKKLKEYRYTPLIKFNGSLTECFSKPPIIA